MTVETGNDATQFHFLEYINRIFFEVYEYKKRPDDCNVIYFSGRRIKRNTSALCARTVSREQTNILFNLFSYSTMSFLWRVSLKRSFMRNMEFYIIGTRLFLSSTEEISMIAWQIGHYKHIFNSNWMWLLSDSDPNTLLKATNARD